jgi:hypothetical protein
MDPILEQVLSITTSLTPVQGGGKKDKKTRKKKRV